MKQNVTFDVYDFSENDNPPSEFHSEQPVEEVELQEIYNQLMVFYYQGRKLPQVKEYVEVKDLMPVEYSFLREGLFANNGETEAQPLAAAREIHHDLMQQTAIKVWQDKIQGIREEVHSLIQRLKEMVRTYRAQSSGAVLQEQMQTALGDTRGQELDARIFSRLLEKSRTSGAMNDNRASRMEATIRILQSMAAFYGDVEEKQAADILTYATSIDELWKRNEQLWRQLLTFFSALKIARLEASNSYHEEIHDEFFSCMSRECLSGKEVAFMPPVLVHLRSSTLGDLEKAELVNVLASGYPFKILFEIDAICEQTPDQYDWYNHFDSWALRLGQMATSLGNAYVLQTNGSDEELLADGFMAGMKTSKPALFIVYTPHKENTAQDHRLLAELLEASRILPAFEFDPNTSENAPSRLTVRHNRSYKQDWVSTRFAYRLENEDSTSLTRPLTPADYLLMEPQFASHFLALPPERWHPQMVPFDQFLSMNDEQRREHFPYILAVDHENRLWRVLPTRRIAASTVTVKFNWQVLRNIGRVKDSDVYNALEKEKKSHREDVEKLQASFDERLEEEVKKVKAQTVAQIMGGLLGGKA